MRKGILLEELSWKEAEGCLKKDTVVVIPLGAAAKEHGLHLQLRNDFLIAEFLKMQILQSYQAVILPTLNYFYYPAFVEYPGSISLSEEISAEIVVQICRNIARFGPCRFYVLNTGISTLLPLQAAESTLSSEKIILRYTDLHATLESMIQEISEQEGGSHADEIETSLMLEIAPETVRMDLAVEDFDPDARGYLSREKKAGFSYSESGVWGNPGLANKSKGGKIVKCLLDQIIKDLDSLRETPS